MAAERVARQQDGLRRLTPPGPVIVVVAGIAAVVGNALVVTVAARAGVDPGWPPLTLPVYGAFTVLGVLAGWAGWQGIERRAAEPRRVLALLVPAVLAASFLPDIALLTFRFIPGTTEAGALALMAMHVVTVAIAVPGYVLASRR